MGNIMGKIYQKPEIIEEIELDRKVVYASDPYDPCVENPRNCD